jgi:predicted molibdopterin-dependent oxidoreductase YjgC
MFKRRESPSQDVTIYVDNRPLRAGSGENLAAVLLEHGIVPFRRHDVSAEPRAPYCMIGKCFDCLIQVDGRANCQACMTTVRDGMRVECQRPVGERDI